MTGRNASATPIRGTSAAASPTWSTSASLCCVPRARRTCHYFLYGLGPHAHRRRASGAAAAPALEDADRAGVGRGARGGGGADRGGGDPAELGRGGGAPRGGRGRDPRGHAVADRAGAALADDDLRADHPAAAGEVRHR